MSQFQEQPLPISVPTVADLATARARTANGAVVQTTGRTTAGDGGAGAYIYRRTGRSSVTLNGFNIAGSGVDDYWENTDKLQANAIQWGCDRTGSTDCSAALVAATAALPTGGSIVFPAGTYLISQDCSIAHCVFQPGAKIKTSGAGVDVTIASYTATQTQHVFDVTSGGTIIITQKHPVTVENWGAVGDGVTDDSAAGQAAINATLNVQLLAKTYRATWVIDPGNQAASIWGSRTRLVAANNNEFALTLDNNFPGGVCRVSEIEFYGTTNTKLKHGLQIATGSAVFVDNCWFSHCGIGLANNSAIELRFNHCWFRNNYLAMLMTCRNNSSGYTIDDIAGQSVTLSNRSPVPITHPSENSFVGMTFNSNDIAFVCEQPGNSYANAQDFLFDKTVVQYGKIGFLFIADSGTIIDTCTVLNNCWCEFNERTHLIDFDGVTYNSGDYIVQAGVVEINNGIVETVRASNTADVRINSCSINETSKFYKDSTASILLSMCYIDNILCEMPVDVAFSNGQGRGSVCKSSTPTGTSYALSGNSRLKVAYSGYTGNQAPVYGGTLLGTVTDGVLERKQCAAYRSIYNNGALIPFTSVEGKRYSVSFSVKSHCPSYGFTANYLTSSFDSVAHGFVDGMEVVLSTTGTLPGGLSASTNYFVINQTTDAFQLSGPTDLLLIADADGGTYDDAHTAIGTLHSGDFDIQFDMQQVGGSFSQAMVMGIALVDTPNASTNYTLPIVGVQWIDANTVKIWKSGAETTYAHTWSTGEIRINRTGTTMKIFLDGSELVSETNASFTSADVYPIWTSDSDPLSQVLLRNEINLEYQGAGIITEFRSNGGVVTFSDNGTGTHSVSQVPAFSLRNLGVDAGVIAGTRTFPVTADWSTWSIHGIASAGGSGSLFISPAAVQDVRAFLISAVNVVSHETNAELIEYALANKFFSNRSETPVLATGASATADDIITVLQSLNLVKQS